MCVYYEIPGYEVHIMNYNSGSGNIHKYMNRNKLGK